MVPFRTNHEGFRNREARPGTRPPRRTAPPKTRPRASSTKLNRAPVVPPISRCILIPLSYFEGGARSLPEAERGGGREAVATTRCRASLPRRSPEPKEKKATSEADPDIDLEDDADDPFLPDDEGIRR